MLTKSSTPTSMMSASAASGSASASATATAAAALMELVNSELASLDLPASCILQPDPDELPPEPETPPTPPKQEVKASSRLPAVPRQHAKVRAKTPPAPSDPRSYAKLRALRPKISEAERAFEASVGAARASSDARIAAHADQYGARDAAGEARVALRELGAARSSQYAASAAAHAHALATRRLEVRCGVLSVLKERRRATVLREDDGDRGD